MNPNAPNAHEHTTPRRMRTTVHVDNLHCQSCVDSVTRIISDFLPFDANKDLEKVESIISDVDVSLPNRTVSFTHPEVFIVGTVLKQLDAAGFDVWLDSDARPVSPPPKTGTLRWRSLLNPFTLRRSQSTQREAVHREICGACRASEMSKNDDATASDNVEKQAWHESRFALEGMTCRYANWPDTDACEHGPLTFHQLLHKRHLHHPLTFL
jgi:Cu+-exporting ATPase